MAGRSSVNSPFRLSARQQRRVIALAAAALLGGVTYATRSSPPQGAVVSRVIDGDTIKLSDGRLVRYIGIDTPEVRRRNGQQWVKDPEPMGLEAAERNRQLVEGKPVRLEQDVQPRDRYGRLLAYVYVGEMMVNEQLLREGFAQPMTIPPNVKYVERFRQAAKEAREARKGLWSGEPHR